ncbi:Mitochondrial copper homeostasis protein [Blastocladiella emersonii ATCC 22665]|nr:Mitochondrial copper homeostasis protein [Blastocladiella emersonii ATCC 22665]
MSPLEDVMFQRHLSALEFWRDYGAAAQLKAAIGGVCAKDPIGFSDGFFEPLTSQLPLGWSNIKAKIHRQLMGSSGDCELDLSGLVLTRRAVSELNALMAGRTDNGKPVKSIHTIVLARCPLDLERLFDVDFPGSVLRVEVASFWLKWLPWNDMMRRVRWPEHLGELTIKFAWLRASLVPRLLPTDTGSLSHLRKLRIEHCTLQNPSTAKAIGRALPRGLEVLSLYSSKLNAAMLTAMIEHLPPTLTSLDLGGSNLRVNGGSGKPAGSPPPPTWPFPASLKTLSLAGAKLDLGTIAVLLSSLPPALTSLNLSGLVLCDGKIFGSLYEMAVRALGTWLPRDLKRLVTSYISNSALNALKKREVPEAAHCFMYNVLHPTMNATETPNPTTGNGTPSGYRSPAAPRAPVRRAGSGESVKDATADGKFPSLNEYCRIEAKESFKCLETYAYDRKICNDLFQDYQNCKKEWQAKRKALNRG